ncbi:prolactin precursor [Takifugu rubripes]|uniref:Prolactin n=3 Tax=Takifugu TaxID=31032 RepID=Q1HAY9_TAKRU|nr:prolactin precursor [Takifugu rubripes]XP_056871337.1 prolactin [Takifugu flavidus]TNM97481.1 hypothetical protein fugu_015637 [Takifugu bimaculatus]TWW69455.1 Prolactin [Takifugu flavidus]BAE94534.1 prolactin [Takifugu rubripes]BBK03975.1 prolactin [Takifugu rubripes]|eukprot:NP_001072092.1 prolactin precursor [Takifugu rubripes]
MAHRKPGDILLLVTVLCMVATARGTVSTSDLLDRVSEHSDMIHSLSTILSQDLDSQLPPVGRMLLPRPSMCHTSSLQTPMDKEQALQISKSDLLSLARSLLHAWADPLLFLSTSAMTLPQLAQSSVSNKIQELKQHSQTLGDGLNILSDRMGQAAQAISSLPYSGGNDLGQDKISKLINLHFLLSCFRRDSHKIDSFLKVLRCRMANMVPEMC